MATMTRDEIYAKVSETLVEARGLFDDVVQWQRASIIGGTGHGPADELALRRVAASKGLPNAKRLKQHLDATRLAVRSVYVCVLGSGA